MSVQVRYAGKMSIFPEMLQVIELAYLGQEDMYQSIDKVDSHPLVGLEPHHAYGLLAHALAYHVAHRFGYSLYLCG